MRFTHVFTIFFLFFYSTSYSQDDAGTKKTGFTLEVGAGLYTNDGVLAYGRSTWFTVSRDNVMYKLRVQRIREFLTLGDSPEEYSRNIALMIGKKRGNDFVHVGASVGLGVTHGVYRGEFIKSNGFFSSEYERKTFTRLSLPLELDVTFKPFEVFGFGFALTGDLNERKSSLGLLLKVGVGIF